MARKNTRKAIVLRVLNHFYACWVTPLEMTRFVWRYMTPEERAATTFEQEWFRFSRACSRLASKDFYPRPYIRAKPRGKESEYAIGSKGARVLSSISHYELTGRAGNALYERLPRWAGGKLVEPGVVPNDEGAAGPAGA